MAELTPERIAEVERLRAEIEDWRGRLATQCGQTLAARKQRDDASSEIERLRSDNAELQHAAYGGPK